MARSLTFCCFHFLSIPSYPSPKSCFSVPIYSSVSRRSCSKHSHKPVCASSVPSPSDAGSVNVDIISSSEYSDGSLVFRFGEVREIAKNVEVEEFMDEDSSDFDMLEFDHTSENEVKVSLDIGQRRKSEINYGSDGNVVQDASDCRFGLSDGCVEDAVSDMEVFVETGNDRILSPVSVSGVDSVVEVEISSNSKEICESDVTTLIVDTKLDVLSDGGEGCASEEFSEENDKGENVTELISSEEIFESDATTLVIASKVDVFSDVGKGCALEEFSEENNEGKIVTQLISSEEICESGCETDATTSIVAEKLDMFSDVGKGCATEGISRENNEGEIVTQLISSEPESEIYVTSCDTAMSSMEKPGTEVSSIVGDHNRGEIVAHLISAEPDSAIHVTSSDTTMSSMQKPDIEVVGQSIIVGDANVDSRMENAIDKDINSSDVMPVSNLLEAESTLNEDTSNTPLDELINKERTEDSPMLDGQISSSSSNLIEEITTDDGRTSDIVEAPKREEVSNIGFVLSSGAASLPHPFKALTGREDVYFVACQSWLGVADGVGQWSLEGINARLFARELMENCEQIVFASKNVPITNPVEVLTRSAAETQSQGSSTVLVAYFDGQSLHIANIGDSGFVIIRHGTVFKRHTPMVHEFNFPLQIANGDDPSELVEEYKIYLDEGDVIVLATDGLFDNLYDQEIASIVSKSLRARLTPQEVAALLATRAQEVGQSASTRSPFADAAQAAGYVGYTGGKLDNVTVIVSLVQNRSYSDQP